VGCVLAMGLLIPGLVQAEAQAVSPVPKLDLKRFSGAWYEMALYPNKKEKKCVSDGVVLYALGDKPGRLQVVTSCMLKGGATDVRNANGKLADKSGDGKLKVSYLWPFSTKYWVLATGPEYEWVVVGSPDHKLLWILSRTAVMKAETMDEAKAKAGAMGFDTAKLVVSGHHR
jgi:apolipoprotein D and lipocalin family protein